MLLRPVPLVAQGANGGWEVALKGRGASRRWGGFLWRGARVRSWEPQLSPKDTVLLGKPQCAQLGPYGQEHSPTPARRTHLGTLQGRLGCAGDMGERYRQGPRQEP